MDLSVSSSSLGLGRAAVCDCGNEECAFFTSDVYKIYNLWSCQKVCDALVYLLDNIFIRFGTKLYRQTIGIPMGTNCDPNGTVSTKIYDQRDDFDFDIVNFPFLEAMSPDVSHMGYTYLNLLDSPELLQILVSLTTVIKPLLPNFLGRSIVILNFTRLFEILPQTQCLGRKT